MTGMPPVALVGLLLAGGLSRRMGGGDKTLRPLGGRTILDHVIERVRPQVEPLVLNANGDPARFAGTGLPVAPDVVPDFAGPLAGVLTGLDWAAEHAPGARWVATFATDAPFLPTDLVERLLAASSGRAPTWPAPAPAAGASRLRPLAGPPAPRPAPRHAGRADPQSRRLDRALPAGDSGFPHRSGRSLLQHQPPRRPGRG